MIKVYMPKSPKVELNCDEFVGGPPQLKKLSPPFLDPFAVPDAPFLESSEGEVPFEPFLLDFLLDFLDFVGSIVGSSVGSKVSV